MNMTLPVLVGSVVRIPNLSQTQLPTGRVAKAGYGLRRPQKAFSAPSFPTLTIGWAAQQ